MGYEVNLYQLSRPRWIWLTVAFIFGFVVHGVDVLEAQTRTKSTSKRSVSGKKGTAKSGPGYFVIPIVGAIGQEVTAATMERALKTGLKDDDTVLVLDVDSPGGLVSECEKIVKLLGGHESRRSIAYVRGDALSAAAIIALTCDEIYLNPIARIGAATAIRTDGEDGPSEVDEKFKSVWRTSCRRAAEIGGHNPLFAEAMIDPKVQLRLVEREGGEKDVEEVLFFEPTDAKRRRMVSVKGKLLTATAKEATRWGLGSGVVSELEAVGGTAEGLAGWAPVSRKGEEIMARFARDFERATKTMERAAETFEKEFERAVATDPTTKSYPLNRNRRFTAASRYKWVKYSKACHKHLRKAEQALLTMEKTCKRYPVLQGHVEVMKTARESLKDARKRIEGMKIRRGG